MRPEDQFNEARSLLNIDQVQEPNRRSAMKTALGVGYAMAAVPLMAQTAINTPADGLTTGEHMIDVGGI